METDTCPDPGGEAGRRPEKDLEQQELARERFS